MQATEPFVNIAAYKFVTFEDTAEKRAEFRALCEQSAPEYVPGISRPHCFQAPDVSALII